MPHETPTIESSLADMPKRDWLRAIEAVAEEDGYFQSLGKRHFSAFIERETTLLVTFETYQGMHALSDRAQPLGWDMVRNHDWSHLCLASDGDTWFRAEEVYAYFDRLIDDGFFDEFDQVLFYGAGPCAYAAAAYSVASPGAAVVAIQPQATLNPRITDWDDRFTDMRILDFTSRYGYAPDMLDAAERVFVLYDPREKLDAMHAALFTRANVTKLRMPFMGDALQTDLLEIDQLDPLLQAAAGATTNSASGVSNFDKVAPVLDRMAEIGLPLCTHGEVTDSEIDIFDREAVFIDRVLDPIRRAHPALRVIMEHITTADAADYVRSADSGLAATITTHHLVINRNHILAGGIRPHYYCLPVAKRESHRLALRQAATSGDPRFFLGTDSAPHTDAVKLQPCGCAGCFTAPNTMSILAQVFEEDGALDKLEAFTSLNGPAFYGLPPNETRITLRRETPTHPTSIDTPDGPVTVFDPGFDLHWTT